MQRLLILIPLFLMPLNLFAKETEVLKILRGLIQINTSNPPGNETFAAEYIRNLLGEEGIYSEIIEAEPGRGNLVARLKGEGTKPALILLGHLDVVPADPAEWDVPPFSAEVKDGKIWGRGALDMKGLVAMEITTLLRLKRQNKPLAGDVVLVLCADEEAGGKSGAEFLVKNYWDKIQGKYLFNEGSVGVQKMGMNIYPIQVAEKGVAWMRLTVHGTSGHGSIPSDDNAVANLARAVNEITTYRFPITKTDVLAAFLERLSPHLPFPKSLGVRYFFNRFLGPVLQRMARSTIEKDRAISAVLSDTMSPTMLKAGYKVNVIPAEAEATIDARILPGETPEGFLEEVGGILEKSIGSHFDLTLIASSTPNQSDFHTDYFWAIEKAIQKSDPEAVTAPMISAGATDSRFFREKGVIAYGIIPLLLMPEELSGLHGKNERIPVRGLETGAQIVYDIVKEMETLTRPPPASTLSR